MVQVATPPNTVTKLSHSITIRAAGPSGAGITIGAINSWTPNMTRGIAELYELGTGVTPGGGENGGSPHQFSQYAGEPFEKVPSNISGMTIDVNRYDLYTIPMERAFGTADITRLANQSSSFYVRENWTAPSTAGGDSAYTDVYNGCWFSKLGRQIQATGDRVVMVTATLEYTSKDRVPFQRT